MHLNAVRTHLKALERYCKIMEMKWNDFEPNGMKLKIKKTAERCKKSSEK